jgi:hypothetical protein
MAKKIIVGLTENIRIDAKDGKNKTIKAKIDTGASKSSMDINLASELKLGPVVGTKLVKSAHGNSLRPMIVATINLAGKKIKARFTLADRKHLRYKVLVGVNILKRGFLIDPLKK